MIIIAPNARATSLEHTPQHFVGNELCLELSHPKSLFFILTSPIFQVKLSIGDASGDYSPLI